MNVIGFLICKNCDKELCDYGYFSCKCNNVPDFIEKKCDLCESSGYDCECANTFTIECPLK